MHEQGAIQIIQRPRGRTKVLAEKEPQEFVDLFGSSAATAANQAIFLCKCEAAKLRHEDSGAEGLPQAERCLCRWLFWHGLVAWPKVRSIFALSLQAWSEHLLFSQLPFISHETVLETLSLTESGFKSCLSTRSFVCACIVRVFMWYDCFYLSGTCCICLLFCHTFQCYFRD